jgi:hypothetical protein
MSAETEPKKAQGIGITDSGGGSVARLWRQQQDIRPQAVFIDEHLGFSLKRRPGFSATAPEIILYKGSDKLAAD